MKLLIKGIVTQEDAALALQHGADGIIVSNHGGRSEDSKRASIDCLPEVIAAVNGKVPVLVDAGVGTASDAAVAMELGCDGVLMNTAIAEAKDPLAMARAMRLAVESGRLAYLSGRMGRRLYADPSSPLAGLI